MGDDQDNLTDGFHKESESSTTVFAKDERLFGNIEALKAVVQKNINWKGAHKVVVALLVEWSLLIPEVRGSDTDIDIIFISSIYCQQY